MNDVQLARAIAQYEQRQYDRSLLDEDRISKPSLSIRIAADRAADKAALRRAYIQRGIERREVMA